MSLLTIDIEAHAAKFFDTVDKMQRDTQRVARSMESAFSGVKSVLAGLGVGISVAGFVQFVRGAVDAADRLHDLNLVTGISVERLAGLQLAAKQSGGDLESIATSISKFSANIGKDQGEKFKALGITAKEPLEAFKQLADIFVKVQDPQLRAALGAAALGKSWAGAAPLLAEGSKKIQEMVDKGTQVSGITKEMTDKADEFNDQLSVLSARSQAAGINIGRVLLPGLIETAKAMSDLSDKGHPVLSLLRGFAGLGKIPFDLAIPIPTGKQAEIAEIGKEIAQIEKQAKSLRDALSNDSLFVNPETTRNRLSTFDNQLKILRDRQRDLAATPAADPSTDPAKTAADEKARKEAEERVRRFLNEQKAVGDLESVYRSLLKPLEDKLLLDKQSTEVEKLLLNLDQLTNQQFSKLTVDQLANLEVTAHSLDLKEQEKRATENYIKVMEAEQEERNQINDVIGANNKSYLDSVTAAQKLIENIQFETKLLGLNNREREIAIGLRDLEVTGLDKESEAFGQLSGKLKQVIADKTIAEENKKVADEVTDAWKTAAKDMQRSMSGFFFDIMQGNLTDLAGSFKRTVDKMVADALAAKAATALLGKNFEKTGEVGGLAGGVVDWAKKFFGMGGGPNYITGGAGAPFWTSGEALLFAQGGVMGPNGPLNLKRYAYGGVANTPQLAMFGEGSRPEAYVPLADGRNIPVKLERAGGGDMHVTNNFTINGPIDNRARAEIAAAAYEGAARAHARNR